MAVQVRTATVGRESCKPLDENLIDRHVRDSLRLTRHLGVQIFFYQEHALAHIVATFINTEDIAYN
jgi:hypothetical protein